MIYQKLYLQESTREKYCIVRPDVYVEIPHTKYDVEDEFFDVVEKNVIGDKTYYNKVLLEKGFLQYNPQSKEFKLEEHPF